MIKEFGIYTSAEYNVISIIVKKNDDKIIGVNIRLQCVENCTNVDVNNYIFLYMDEIKVYHTFAINLNNGTTDILKNYGYLGQVDEYLRDDLIKHVRSILYGTGWVL